MKSIVKIILLLLIFSKHVKSMDNLEVMRINDFSYFQLSLISPYTSIVQPEEMHNIFNKLVRIAPQVGYYSTPYEWYQSAGVIQLRSDMIAATIPDSIRKYISFFNEVETIDYTILFFNSYVDEKRNWDANIVFHPWARTWVTNPKQGLYFNVQVAMGVFEADGIMLSGKNSIAFDALSNQTINVHNGKGLAFSPNNARFVIDKTREISNFWVVAHSLDKKHICVSFVTVINSMNAQKKLASAFNNAITLGDLINNIKNMTEKFVNEDKKALLHSVDTILAIAQGKKAQENVEVRLKRESQELQDSLYELTKTLELIKKSL